MNQRLIQYYTLTNKPVEVRKWMMELISISADETSTIRSLATGLLLVKQFLGAEVALRHCLTASMKSEPDVWATYDTMSMLGEALAGLKKMEEAEPLLKNGYDGMKLRLKKIPAESSGKQLSILIEMEAAADRLIKYYTELKRADALKYWQLEAMTLSVAMTSSMDQCLLELLKAGKTNVAEGSLKEYLDIRQTNRPNTWVTFVVMSQLGRVLVMQKKNTIKLSHCC